MLKFFVQNAFALLKYMSQFDLNPRPDWSASNGEPATLDL
jgi:hypothetical protein